MGRSGIPDRLVFAEAGQQRNFILRAKEKLDIDTTELAKLLRVHPRSVRDWTREKYNMPNGAAIKIREGAGISIPPTARVKKWIDHVTDAGYLGGAAVMKKYQRVPNNEYYRKEQWREWWSAIGQHLPSRIHNTPLPFNIPPVSKQLAEFVGIMLGDGGISRYQLGITLHRYDDKPYSRYVKKLVKELFNITPSNHPHKNSLADTIYVSRIELVKYANKTLGLAIGNKVRQQVDIPQWIKDDKNLTIACIRGLVDTDGCVFTHKYTVKKKEYTYKKLCFTNYSRPLLASVFETLLSLGMNPRIAGGIDVRLDSKKDMQTYFRLIGSHNPKHLKRYKK